MDKKSIISLIIVAVVAIIACVLVIEVTKGPTLPGISLLPGELPRRPGEEVTVGYGQSVKNDLKEAVAEAVSLVMESFKEEPPEYAILFSTVGYDSQELVKEVRRLLPNTKLQGGTVMYGIFTRDGYHVGEKGSLALMAVSSPKIDFGVGGADVEESSAKEAGKQAILAAIKDAGKEGEMPKLIYTMGSFGNEEGLLAGIEEVVGKEVPIVGGSAFDDDGTGQWSQLVDDKVYNNGIALTVFYTDLKVGWAYESGYETTEHRGIVTKVGERTMLEIDGRPALDVYDEWTGGLVSTVSKGSQEDPIIEIVKTALFPFAKIKRGTHGETYYITIHPYLWHMKEKSISYGISINEGEEVAVVHGTWEANLNHARTTPAKALEDWQIKKGEGYFAIYSYCLGKMLTLPEEERSKIPLLVNSTLGNIPFIGGNTGGEQGYLTGIGNQHGHLANDIIIFAPAE